MTIGVIATVFVLVSVAELPDKTMIATLVMGSRGRPFLVWLGAAGAFLIHVTMAVVAGRLIELLPHRTLEIVITIVFFAGAIYLLFIPEKSETDKGEREGDEMPDATGDEPGPGVVALSPWRTMATAFGVILVGEFGDLTQLLTVNLTAHYHQPWSVFVGAYAGLVTMAAIGVLSGRALLRLLPVQRIRQIGGVILLGFAAYGIYGLVK